MNFTSFFYIKILKIFLSFNVQILRAEIPLDFKFGIKDSYKHFYKSGYIINKIFHFDFLKGMHKIFHSSS